MKNNSTGVHVKCADCETVCDVHTGYRCAICHKMYCEKCATKHFGLTRVNKEGKLTPGLFSGIKWLLKNR